MACHTKVDWADLPDELLMKIGECFLATEDLDYNTAFRGVCTSWHKAMPQTEFYFYLTKWFMVGQTLPRSGDFTFLNLSTGRYFKKDLFDFHQRYYIVGVTKGGLIVLGERTQPHEMSLLNPLSGATKQFRANIPADLLTSVAVTNSPMMVFVSTDTCIRWADQNSPVRENDYDFGDGEFDRGQQKVGFLYSITAFGRELYATHTGDNGAIYSTNTQVQHLAPNVTMERVIPGLDVVRVMDDIDRFYLVESEGELLLVIGGRVAPGQPVVYRVNTQNRLLEPVSGIGSRALFVSIARCISVDTSIMQTAEPGSIYYSDFSYIRRYCEESGAWSEEPTLEDGYGRNNLYYNPYYPKKFGPHRLDKILAGFYRRGEFYELLMGNEEGDHEEVYRSKI